MVSLHSATAFPIPGISFLPAQSAGFQTRSRPSTLDPKQALLNGLSPVDIGNALATDQRVLSRGTARNGQLYMT